MAEATRARACTCTCRTALRSSISTAPTPRAGCLMLRAVPEGLDEETEGSGRGLCPPSVEYPILQTYVDVCVSSLPRKYGDDLREFIATTFLWAPHWLNERTLARRPWLHQRPYIQIDRYQGARATVLRAAEAQSGVRPS